MADFHTGVAWIDQALDQALSSPEGSKAPPPLPGPQDVAPLDIIVPVYDAPECLQACVASILETVGAQHRIWLCDDASPDPAIAPLVQSIATGDSRVRYQRRPQNLGLVGNLNAALAETDRDVVILNSDTVVTPGWLPRMWRCLSQSSEIGVVSPLSDRATLLSVNRQQINPPAFADTARAVAETAVPGGTAIPVAVGFCMLIRRELIDQIGLFDPAFSPGYGEEVDFCLRAWRSGWRVLACTDAWVHHQENASFGDTTGSPWRSEHERLIASRWPAYESLVRSWWRINPLRVQIERLAARGRGLPLVVHLLHRWHTPGGTERLTRQLINTLSDEFCHLVIVPGLAGAAWADAEVHPLAPNVELMLINRGYLAPQPIILGESAALNDARTDHWLARVLAASGARLLHVHHLLGWGSLMPALLAKSLNIPVIVSLHCLHYLCPDYSQIGPDGAPCGKRLVETEGECVNCLRPRSRMPGNISQQLPNYLVKRRTLTRQVMKAADALISPSRFLGQRISAAFGPDVVRKTHILPHPVEPFGASAPFLVHPGKPLRVAYLGGIRRQKGAACLIEAAALLTGETLRFDLHGPDQHRDAPVVELPANCQVYGTFTPDERDRIIDEADLIVVPSIVEETFSLVVSEAWARARPVLVSNVGALPERVQEGENGWIVPAGDTDALAERLRWLNSQAGRQALIAASRRLLAKVSRDDSAVPFHQHRTLYRELLSTAPEPTPDAPAVTSDWSTEQVARFLRTPGREMEQLFLASAACPSALLPSQSSLAVCVIGGTDNTKALARSRESAKGLSSLECLVTDAEQDRLATARSSHVLLLAAGECLYRPTWPLLLAWLARIEPDDWLCFDHLHHSQDEHLHGLVIKPDFDPWLAASGTDFDCGWVVPISVARHLLRDPVNRNRWLERLLGQAAEAPVHGIAAPLLTRPDEHLAHAARRLAKTDTSGIELSSLPPVIIHGNGQTDDIQASLEALAALDPAPDQVDLLAGQWRWSPGQWPDGWGQGKALHGSGCRLLLRAGVLVTSVEAVCQPLAWLRDQRIGALGLAVRSADGRPFAGFRLHGHSQDRLIARPPWPGGPRHQAGVLRRCQALTLDMVLVRCQADSTNHALKERLAGWLRGLPLQNEHLVCSDRICGRWNDISDRLPPLAAPENGGQPSPWSWRLNRNRIYWQPDPLAMQISAIPGGGDQIAALVPDETASSQYRILQPLNLLAAAGKIRPPLIINTSRHGWPSADNLQRLGVTTLLTHNVFDARLAALADELGVPLLVSIDDLVTDLPRWNRLRLRRRPDFETRFSTLLAAASGLIVSTPTLADAFAELNCPITIVANALPTHPWQDLAQKGADRPGKGSRRLRVGWAGAQQHEGDLRLLRDAVRATADQVDWILFGMCPDYLRPWVAEVHEPVSWVDYPAALASLELDLAVAPLVDHPFNRCKSANKLLEFGRLGIPVLAQDLEPYQDAPVVRVAGNSPEWRQALQAALADKANWPTRGKALQQWVCRQHQLPARLKAWEDALLNRAGRAAKEFLHQ